MDLGLGELGQQIADGIREYLQGVGLPVPEQPVCEEEPPAGVEVLVVERSLVAACPEAAGDQVRVKVANQRGYGVLLDLPDGVVEEDSAPGSMRSRLYTWVASKLDPGVVYVPPVGTTSLLVDMAGRSEVTVGVEPSEATLVADFLWTLCRTTNGVCAAIGEGEAVADCMLSAVQRGGAEADFQGLMAAAGDCTSSVLPGGRLVFAVASAASAWVGVYEYLGDWITGMTHSLTVTYEPFPPGAQDDIPSVPLEDPPDKLSVGGLSALSSLEENLALLADWPYEVIRETQGLGEWNDVYVWDFGGTASVTIYGGVVSAWCSKVAECRSPRWTSRPARSSNASTSGSSGKLGYEYPKKTIAFLAPSAEAASLAQSVTAERCCG